MTHAATRIHGSALHPEDTARILRRIRGISWMMDSAFRVPGTRHRFGIDPLLGLLPGVGDAAAMLVQAYVVAEAARLGVPRAVLVRMIVNVLLDVTVGSVPLLGDAFDFFFKANRRNLRLLGIDPETVAAVQDARSRPRR